MGSANPDNSLLPKGPLPGQKSIRLAKKGADRSFPIAGFRRFSPGIPLPPLLFAETNRGNREGNSRPFLASAPAFLPGQQGDGFKQPTQWEMIQKIKYPRSGERKRLDGEGRDRFMMDENARGNRKFFLSNGSRRPALRVCPQQYGFEENKKHPRSG